MRLLEGFINGDMKDFIVVLYNLMPLFLENDFRANIIS